MQRSKETADKQIKAQAAKLKPITELFPQMENAVENIEELRTMGIQNNDIRQLLTGKEIYYTYKRLCTCTEPLLQKNIF